MIADLLRTLAAVYLPTLAVCALFYWWSRATSIDWLARLLRSTSLIAAIYFLLLILLIFTAARNCDGNVLKGLSNCTLFPDFISRMLTSLGYMSYALGIFYALILVSAGGIVEALKPPKRD